MPWSALIPTGFLVSRGTRVCNVWRPKNFAYGTFTLYGVAFQPASTIFRFCNSTWRLQPPDHCIPLPPEHNACRLLHARRFRLFPFRSPLLRESLRFLFLQVLRCFSSLGSPPNLRQDDSALPEPGCPIRKSTDLRLCAPPRGFSQLTTSFFASSCLGIHRMPLAT